MPLSHKEQAVDVYTEYLVEIDLGLAEAEKVFSPDYCLHLTGRKRFELKRTLAYQAKDFRNVHSVFLHVTERYGLAETLLQKLEANYNKLCSKFEELLTTIHTTRPAGEIK